MSVVTISGEIGCRYEELARLTGARLGYEYIGEHRMSAMLREEFGEAGVPDKAWSPAARGGPPSRRRGAGVEPAVPELSGRPTRARHRAGGLSRREPDAGAQAGSR